METGQVIKLFCQQCGKPFPVKKDDASDVKCPDCGTEALRPAECPGPGVVIGDFLIEKVISSGGMGLVFEARQLSLDRPVALKVLQGEYTQDRDYVAGLFREARAAAKVNHPNIVQAYAVGDDDGVFYFAMELVRGKTMKSIIAKEGILPFEKSAKVICDIAHGLAVAWREQKLVHQDIKPDNIMMDESRDLAKLADLGLAKTSSVDAIDAGEDEVFGTPQYISPEQLTGVPTDIRSDIYSLGATFFQFVTGRFPYIAPTIEELARMHDAGNLEPPQSVNPEVPDELNRIIIKMMARNIEERYQTAEELIQDLEAFLQTYRPGKKDWKKLVCKKLAAWPWKKISKISAFAAGGIVAVGVVAAAALFLWGRYGKLPEALQPVGKAVFGSLIERPEPEIVAETPVVQKEKSPYEQAVAGVLTNFSGVEAVDRQWLFLSAPGNAEDAALLSENIGAFAKADEARCAVARKNLRSDFIRLRNQRRAEDAERKRLALELEQTRKRDLERVRQEEAARKRKHLADNQSRVADSLRKCMEAFIQVVHGAERSVLDGALSQAEYVRESLSADTPEEQLLKKQFSDVLKEFPAKVEEIRQKMDAIKKINADKNISFNKNGRHVVAGFTEKGDVRSLDGIIFTFDELEKKQQERILSKIGQNGAFYFNIYRSKIPAAQDVKTAGMWQTFVKLMNP